LSHDSIWLEQIIEDALSEVGMESRSLIDLRADCDYYGVFLSDIHRQQFYYADQIEDC